MLMPTSTGSYQARCCGATCGVAGRTEGAEGPGVWSNSRPPRSCSTPRGHRGTVACRGSEVLLHRRRGLRGIEALDHLVGDVEAWIVVGDARVADAEDGLELLLLGDRLDHREQLLLELALQIVLQLVHLRLRVLLRDLDLALETADVLVQRAARRLVEDGAALAQLRLQRLQLLLLVADLGDLLGVQVRQPFRGFA